MQAKSFSFESKTNCFAAFGSFQNGCKTFRMDKIYYFRPSTFDPRPRRMTLDPRQLHKLKL